MEDGKILGRDDFADKYFAENADALVPEKTPEPTPEPEPQKVVVPEFVAPTPGLSSTSQDSGFNFGFTGVRAH